jgi:dTDP-4-dehydrorhamnose reductase
MRIAITGADGQLGRALCRQLGSDAVALSRQDVDITDSAQVVRTIGSLKPDVVINTAAYTQVDQAEREPEACHRLNALAVGALASACNKHHAKLVHVSTDYVYSGDEGRSSPFCETDLPSPRGVYARTKLQGEHEAACCPQHLIIRTCGLYGITPKRNNFVETMLRLGQEGRRLRVVDDQHCTPSYVLDVATAMLYLIHIGATGLYHVVNGGQTTWFDLASAIFRLAGMEVSLEPITTAQYGAPAPRPGYSVLSTDKYQVTGGPIMPHWQAALERYLEARQGV